MYAIRSYYVSHSVIMDGGIINFKMDNIPNKNRGTTKEAFPYSLSLDQE